jgi:hypothetical protein
MKSIQFQTASSAKLDDAGESIEPPSPKPLTDPTLIRLAEQMRQNLIRNVAEMKANPNGPPADWEI